MAIKKLTSEDVHNICISLAQGEKGSVLAKRYNVSHVTISDIRYGRRHGEISKLYNFSSQDLKHFLIHIGAPKYFLNKLMSLFSSFSMSLKKSVHDTIKKRLI